MQTPVVLSYFPETPEKTIVNAPYMYLCDELYKPVNPVLNIGNLPILLLPTEIIRYIMMDLFTTAKARRLCKELRRKIEPVWLYYKINTGITGFELYRYISSQLDTRKYIYLYWLKDNKYGEISWRKQGDNLLQHRGWRNDIKFYDMSSLKYWCFHQTCAKPNLVKTLEILCKRNISRQAATSIATRELISTIYIQTKLALWNWVYLEYYIFDSSDYSYDEIFNTLQNYIQQLAYNYRCHYVRDDIEPQKLREYITYRELNIDFDFGNLSFWLKKCKIFVEKGYIPTTLVLTPSEQFELIKEFITLYSPNPDQYIAEFKKAMKIS